MPLFWVHKRRGGAPYLTTDAPLSRPQSEGTLGALLAALQQQGEGHATRVGTAAWSAGKVTAAGNLPLTLVRQRWQQQT